MQPNSDPSPPNAYRLCFIVEQELGHKTHSQNLRRMFEHEPGFETRWVLPAWNTAGLAGKIPLYRSNWTLQAGAQARRGLAQQRRLGALDGLFFHTQVPAVLALDWIRRYPSVVSLDATPLQYDALGEAYDHHPGPTWLENLKLRQYRACFQAARHLVTWTQWAKDGLTAGYGVSPDKITVVPPGVNVREWARPGAVAKAPGTIKILFVGGNLERKGGIELLEAFRHLRNQTPSDGPRVELHLVTKDPVPEQPGVFPHYGMQPNTPALKDLYFTSDIFCLPTHGDCLPMALAEAGAAEMPIVSTNLAGIPELVLEGQNGYLVAPKDVKSLVDALAQLIADPSRRAEMGVRSREIVSTGHNVEQNAHLLAGILRRVIDESK